VPTETRPDTEPQSYLLSAVRESQAAVVNTLRTWTTMSEQLTRSLRLPVPEVDLAGIVDRAFDVAEQSLAAQRQLAHTLAGVATRQLDATVKTVDTAVEATETTIRERADRVEDLIDVAEDEREQRDRERLEQPRPAKSDAPKSKPAKQESKPDRRTYEERSVEELRERARELEIEGRSGMSKDELVAALRKHAK
jgi:hypothetical protein